MNSDVEELYDYGVLRTLEEATMFVVRLGQPTLILGGSQHRDVLDLEAVGSVALRRRRGGGGLVLLQPDDLWVDWWIPAGDPRWSHDVHVSSVRAGSWWRDELRDVVGGEIKVHEGPMEGEASHRVICFAGIGPGEVFVDDRKAVGVTQWRVREGIFVSTVMHGHGSGDVVRFLRDAPEGIASSLDHQTITSLALADPERLVQNMAASSGPWQVRQLYLTA